MKLYLITVLCTFGLWPVSRTIHPPEARFSAIHFVCNDEPELNKKIIDFVNSKMNKTVGRGECWDLAAQALNTTGASWDKNFGFGKEIHLKKDCIYPGDIMQFED